MQTSQYFAIAWRWWWLLLASLVIGGVGAFVASTRMTPTFEASATLVVSSTGTGPVARNDVETSALLAANIARVITIRPVLQAAVDSAELPLSPGALGRQVTVSQANDTPFIEITAQAPSGVLAQRMANGLAQAFIDSETADLTRGGSTLQVIAPAQAPEVPIAPRKTLNAAIGGLLALVVTATLVILYEYFDDTVKTARQVAELVGLPTIGYLRRRRAVDFTDRLEVKVRPRSSLAEDFRATRTNLAHALRLGDGDAARRVLLVVSGKSGEGKSTVTANLAAVFGDAGYRVVIVDSDLRSPSLHRIFDRENSEGLTNLVLSASSPLDSSVLQPVHPHVSLLPAGPTPPNPSELLGSSAMRSLLADLRSQFDLVLLDSPPVLTVTDAAVLAGAADAVVVVARRGQTRTADLRATIGQVAMSGRPLAGVVLTGIEQPNGEIQYGAEFLRESTGSRPQAPMAVRSAASSEPGPDRPISRIPLTPQVETQRHAHEPYEGYDGTTPLRRREG